MRGGAGGSERWLWEQWGLGIPDREGWPLQGAWQLTAGKAEWGGLGAGKGQPARGPPGTGRSALRAPSLS